MTDRTAWALAQENKALKKVLERHQEVAVNTQRRLTELETANQNLGLTLQRVRTLLAKKRWWSNSPSPEHVREALALLGTLELKKRKE